MRPSPSLRVRILLSIVALALLAAIAGLAYVHEIQPRPTYAADGPALPAPPVTPGSAWTHFAADAGATQYSPLSQITPANVRGLKVAWVFNTGEAKLHGAQLAHSAFSNTPILVGGSLIVCTPWNRVIAVDPATGKQKWAFDPHMTMKQPGWQKYMCRGVAAWRDPAAAAGAPCAERLILATNDLRIIAIDSSTGRLCQGFGQDGQVQVVVSTGQAVPGEVQFNAPPVLVNGVIVVGGMVIDNLRDDAPHGLVRAFDARSGAPKWAFDPIATDANTAAGKTWGNGSAKTHGGGNVWADMSVDEARNVVFVPTTAPSGNGDRRPGDNRYSTSMVALDGATGKIVWDYQIVHHDIFDYDLPSAPLLTDLKVGGRTVPAAVQVTKMGMVFVMDRLTGKPLYPVSEHPVPQSDVAGQTTSPTQPMPDAMPSLMGERPGADNAWGFTPWDRDACRRSFQAARNPGLFAPPSRQGSIMFPWASGGSNLGSRAYDPQRRLLIANTIRTVGVVQKTQKPLAATQIAGRPLTGSGVLLSPLGAPCIKPPWGELVALDLETQKIVWRVPLGTIETLAHLPLPLAMGTPNRGGPLATGGGLVFIGATMDDKIRAFDTGTGRQLWQAHLPAGGQATPMTYMTGGKQYVVIAAGGHAWMGTKPGDAVVAYALGR